MPLIPFRMRPRVREYPTAVEDLRFEIRLTVISGTFSIEVTESKVLVERNLEASA